MEEKESKQHFCKCGGGKEGLKGEEANGERKRIKTYCIQVQIPYGECDHYVWQLCTNKGCRQKKWLSHRQSQESSPLHLQTSLKG